jgi:quercetin dioxygenase-like cupin family protein
MKIVSVVFCALGLAAASGYAQDPVKVAPEIYKVVGENERVRVMHLTVGPGATIPMHSHPQHVAITLTAGALELTTPDGKTQTVETKAEQALLLPAGGHATRNTTKSAMEIIVVEMKGAPGTATLPSERPGMKTTSLLKDARVEVNRATVDPSFREPAGSKHEYDQVVIPLGAGDANVTVDGKRITPWKRGEAHLIGRGVPHESGGGKAPQDVIIVSIK